MSVDHKSTFQRPSPNNVVFNQPLLSEKIQTEANKGKHQTVKQVNNQIHKKALQYIVITLKTTGFIISEEFPNVLNYSIRSSNHSLISCHDKTVSYLSKHSNPFFISTFVYHICILYINICLSYLYFIYQHLFIISVFF